MGLARWNITRSTGPRAGVPGDGSPWRRLGLRLCAGFCLMAMTACAPVFRNHGYTPSDAELEQVHVGVDTRDSVASLVGRPSAAGLLNDVGWYYVESRWKHYGARAPKEIEREVVAITFTEAGVVENVERFGLEKGRVVPLSRRVTDSNIKGVSFIRQLMGSLGQLRADNLVN